MKRRSILSALIAAGAIVFAVSAPAAADRKQTAASAPEKKNKLEGSRPNIILVLMDDVGYGDLACNGHPYVKTPNIDKLSKQSLRFTDFHASPTCSPTRAALMSGKLPFAVGVTHTILERERMALSAVTIAQVLKKAGYQTAIFGKWHLGDEDPYQPDRRGFDEVFIHGGGGIGQRYPGSCADVPGNKYFDPVIKHNGTFVKTHGFCTDVFFRQALGWIKQHKDKPFFVYLAPNAAHAPYIAPEKYLPYYRKHSADEKTANFYGMIENIDDNMGLLLQKLSEWGLTNNTILVFTSDNGSARGDYNAGMKGHKGCVHEGGTREPFFVYWPGHVPVGEVDHLIRHVDLFPTFAALAGAKNLPKDLDGRSILPLLEDPKAPWPDRFTFFHIGRWGKKGVPHWDQGPCTPDAYMMRNFAVRSERWRLHGPNELYDIRADRGENHNVIKQYPEVAQKMLEAYKKWWKKVRPLMVNEDAKLPEKKPFIEEYEKQKRTKGIPDWVPPEI